MGIGCLLLLGANCVYKMVVVRSLQRIKSRQENAWEIVTVGKKWNEDMMVMFYTHKYLEGVCQELKDYLDISHYLSLHERHGTIPVDLLYSD